MESPLTCICWWCFGWKLYSMEQRMRWSVCMRFSNCRVSEEKEKG
ncbi:unnamed protein product [Musa acuminata subsp. burmannicoides]